jgi:anion-transporting  ArsA/GET3 family ATPase
MTDLVEALARYRLVICIGAGGVGKTTVAAALALAAAQRGRRAMVLTIDPARALARALGIEDLSESSQRVVVDAPGTLSAGMLDPKRAWDTLVARHAPTPAVAAELFANPFYQRLSTSFAGATEYIAVEELCRLSESHEHDVIVLDTPPSAHALDVVHAPERIDRLFERDLVSWIAHPARALEATAKFVIRKLQGATGRDTLQEITHFFVALDALVGAVRERSRTARALLQSSDTGFVLVAGPRRLVVDETMAIAERLRHDATPLAAIVVNRVHHVPAVEAARVDASFAALGSTPAAVWLRDRWDDAVIHAATEASTIERLVAAVGAVPMARIADADHDLHSLHDLELVAGALRGYQPTSHTASPVVAINPPAAKSP